MLSLFYECLLFLQILEPHIDEFCKYLSSSTLAALVLMMFVDMATANPKAFVDYLPSLKDLAEQQPMYFIQVIQIIGAIGNIDQVCLSWVFNGIVSNKNYKYYVKEGNKK